MRKMDYFKMDREFAAHTRDYVLTKVMAKAINLEYEKKVADAQTSIDNLENLKGSALEERIPELKEVYTKALLEYESQRDAELERQGKFAYTDADLTLRKDINKLVKDGRIATREEVQSAIVAYLNKASGTECDDSDLVAEIMDKVGNKFDFKALVASDGTVADNLDKGKVLTMVLTTVYAHQVAVGTIKVVDLPEIIRDKYAKKSKKSTK